MSPLDCPTPKIGGRCKQSDCNQILHLSRVGDVITDVKFYENRLRGFGVTGPPKRHFLYLTFIALTTVRALPCCTVMSILAVDEF